jgi:hypothetical protein
MLCERSEEKTDNSKRERVVKHLNRMRSLLSSIVIVDSMSDPIFPWIDFYTMRKNTKTSRQLRAGFHTQPFLTSQH